MIKAKTYDTQEKLWIQNTELKIKPQIKFFDILDSFLIKIGFGSYIRKMCESYYSLDSGGRPPIDPEVYFKMLFIGFFETIRSERGIASRCADSISIRYFLHYELDEATPDHSTLSVIRKRLPLNLIYKVFSFILSEMKKLGMVKGVNLAVDSSVMEANASLSKLKNRMTAESYQEYINKLAEENGVDISDRAAVTRFDRKRKDRKTSNSEWYNPFEPEAKIGKKKDGATDMIYKPENSADLDTGAIVDARLLYGDVADPTDNEEKIATAQARLNDISDEPCETPQIMTVTEDKGYYDTKEITKLTEQGIVCVIPDRIEKRNLGKLSVNELEAVVSTREMVKSEAGKKLLKRRGMHIERSFAHILDAGGMRRTTLRGKENIEKRYIVAVTAYNISMILRLTFGIGTLKQAIAFYHFTIYVFSMLCYYIKLLIRYIESLYRLFLLFQCQRTIL